MGEQDSKQLLRKSGAIENPADAFELLRWVSKAIGEAYQDRFGRPIRVEVKITVRGLGSEK